MMVVFFIRELGVAEGVLAVALLEAVTRLHSHGNEKLEGGVLKDGGILLALLARAILEVAEDDDAGLGGRGGGARRA